jgi:hypothetical protein
MNLNSVTLWGFVATLVLTTVMASSEGLGVSRISLPLMVGSIFTGNRGVANIVGFFAHLVFGWSFALVYALIFESWGRATWWSGALLGVFHGLIVLVGFMPLLPYIHPRMASEYQGPEPTRALEPPGFLGLNYGRRTPLITLLAHLIYGTIIGAFYHLARH